MNSISGIPNVFGQTRNSNTTSLEVLSVGVTSSGGLGISSSNTFIKLDPNPSNDLSLSNLGLICNAMKLSGGSLTGDIIMNGNKITGLETNYPPKNNTQATSWSQVQKIVEDYNLLNWN